MSALNNIKISFVLELVLSALLEKFVFHPGKKEIYWNMGGGVANPIVKDLRDKLSATAFEDDIRRGMKQITWLKEALITSRTNLSERSACIIA